jgi:o-succinylbenzoate---CoA ligase
MKKTDSSFPDIALQADGFGLLTGKEIEALVGGSSRYVNLESSGWEAVRSENRIGPLLNFYLGVIRNKNLLMCPPGFPVDQIEDLSRVLGAWFPHGGEGYAAFLTSGSSGKPKAVVHSYGNLIRAATKMLDRYPQLRNSKLHHLFPAHYMAGILNGLMVPWLGGGGLYLDRAFDFSTPFRLSAAVEKFNTSTAWLSPTMMKVMTEAWRQKNTPPNLWEFALSATGPLSTSVRDEFELCFRSSTLNSYGSTELLFISSECERQPDVSAGTFLPGVSGRIGTSSRAPNQVVESLHITTDTQCEAIVAFSKSSREYEISLLEKGNSFDTRDSAAISPDGLIAISERTDDIVVLGGTNHSLGWIESVALSFPGVVACCAFAPFGGELSDLHLAYETIQGQSTFPEEMLLKFLQRNLQASSPRKLSNMVLPRTHSGKVNRTEVIAKILRKSVE